jgi:DNA-binding transcriptional regulator YhcF (GntR family)
MSGKPINEIMEEIFNILKKEKELSIRQLSLKVGSQWITIEKALNSMKKLNVVKERLGDDNNRKTRLWSLR